MSPKKGQSGAISEELRETWAWTLCFLLGAVVCRCFVFRGPFSPVDGLEVPAETQMLGGDGKGS